MSMETISASDVLWWQKVNGNFEKIVDLPVPIKPYADIATLDAAKNPKLYKNCLSMIGGILHRSNGTASEPLRQLDFIADLDTGTATLPDIVSAYNSLLSDMRAKFVIAT